MQLRIGVEPLANANGDIDPIMNEIDAPVGHEALQLQSRMGCEKPRQGGGDRGLESERTAHANEPAGLRLHSQRRLLSGFRFNHGCVRVFKDLPSNLSQVDASGGAIEELCAEPLLQHRHPPADARLRQPERAGAGRETAMLDDSHEELEVIEVPHRHPPIPSVVPWLNLAVAPELLSIVKRALSFGADKIAPVNHIVVP